MDEGFQPSVFYNTHHDMTAPAVAPPPILTPPAFDTPSLPPGSTILVDNVNNVDEYDDDDEDDNFGDDLDEEDHGQEAKAISATDPEALSPTETDGAEARMDRLPPQSPAPTVPVIETVQQGSSTDPSLEQGGKEAVS